MPTRGQFALVHVAKKELGLTDEAYRDILFVEAQVESSRDLSPAGLDKVLRRFQEMGWQGPGQLAGGRRPSRSARTPPAESGPGELVTPGQQGMLKHLWEDMGWPPGERRQAFAKRLCDGLPWPQTRAQASRLIEALKAMVKRGYSDRVPRKPRRKAAVARPDA